MGTWPRRASAAANIIRYLLLPAQGWSVHTAARSLWIKFAHRVYTIAQHTTIQVTISVYRDEATTIDDCHLCANVVLSRLSYAQSNMME